MRQNGDGTVCSVVSRKKPFGRKSWAYIEFSTVKLIDLFKLQLYRWHLPHTHSSLGISDCLMLCHTGECQRKRNLSKHESSYNCHKPIIHHPSSMLPICRISIIKSRLPGQSQFCASAHIPSPREHCPGRTPRCHQFGT